MNSKPVLIIGRVETAKGGELTIAPLNTASHSETTLEHQRKVAALIAAAYLYRDEPTKKRLGDLAKAAQVL